MHNECKRCVPEKEYCTQKANVCVSGKTRYRKWFEKRITTAKRKWNASNDEKLQKADKTALRSTKDPQTAEKAESEKRGLFHSPVFHITCIIRNICNQKTGLLSLPLSSSETRLWVHRLERDRSAGTSLFVQFRESPASCSDCGCVPKYSQIAS